MFTRAELDDAVNELLGGKHSIQNCEKLAAIYVVLDHLYGEEKPMMQVSHDNKIESEVGYYGSSNFLKTIAGKSAKDVWRLMDELVEAITVLNPRLMNNFYEKLNNI
jgi:hypothetical protein